jgi:hypothetical protein
VSEAVHYGGMGHSPGLGYENTNMKIPMRKGKDRHLGRAANKRLHKGRKAERPQRPIEEDKGDGFGYGDLMVPTGPESSET